MADEVWFWRYFMAIQPFGQKQLGKILLGVSVFFVLLFAVTLIVYWVNDPDMFNPVFGS
jgi:hypothetical protein